MKRLFYFLIVLSCTLWNCGKSDSDVDDPNNPDNPDNPTNVTLDISISDLTFEAKGGQKEFTIYCNSDWTITNNSTWCKTDATNGNGDKTIIVTADPYSETEDQNTNLTIKAGDKTKVLTVTQKHGDAIILTKDKFDVPKEGDNITIEVKSNIEYQVSIPSKFQSWIKQAVKSKAITTKNFSFTISANEAFDKREGYIVFSGNSLKDTVYVYQAQKNQLILTENTYNIPAEWKDITVELKTNVDYDVTIPNDAVTWLFQVTTRAIRTDQLKFHIDYNKGANNRSAKVVIKDKNSDLSDTIYITQTTQGTYAGDVILTTIEEVKAFQKAGYKKVNGNLTIKGKEITTLVQLNNQLEEISGNFTTDYYCKLTNCDGLYGLKKVGGNFNISAGSSEGLNNLEFVGGDFGAMNSNGLNKLKEIGGNFSVTSSFKGLKSLVKIGGDFTPNFSYSSFEGLEQLKEIGGNFKISHAYSDNFKSFKGLNNLTIINGSLQIAATSSCNFLLDFTGLNNLTEIGGDFEIHTTSYGEWKNALNGLTSFNGLNKLKKIGGNFKISCAYTYKALNTLEIHQLDNLSSFYGLENLQEIGGDLEININAEEKLYALNSLTSFAGLSSLNNIGGLKIILNSKSINSDCLGLTSFEGLNNLERINGDFEIKISNIKIYGGATNYLLVGFNSFNGLNKLTYIGGKFRISSESTSELQNLKSFEGLENLQKVNDDFELNNAPYFLSSLNGLNKLNSISGNLTISRLGYLYDFCPLKESLTNHLGTFVISKCGYNPTKYQILNGECSK